MSIPIRIIVALIAIAVMAVRTAFVLRSAGPRGAGSRGALRVREPIPLVLQAASLALGPASLFVFVAYPEVLGPFALPVPGCVRFLGAAAGVFSVGLLYRSHASLGSEFSAFLEVREGQRLITSGPYRFVRHPLYASYLLQILGWALMTANAAVAAAWLPMAAGLAARIFIEEKMLEKHFGGLYAEYRARTGRIIPRARRVRPIRRPK